MSGLNGVSDYNAAHEAVDDGGNALNLDDVVDHSSLTNGQFNGQDASLGSDTGSVTEHVFTSADGDTVAGWDVTIDGNTTTYLDADGDGALDESDYIMIGDTVDLDRNGSVSSGDVSINDYLTVHLGDANSLSGDFSSDVATVTKIVTADALSISGVATNTAPIVTVSGSTASINYGNGGPSLTLSINSADGANELIETGLYDEVYEQLRESGTMQNNVAFLQTLLTDTRISAADAAIMLRDLSNEPGSTAAFNTLIDTLDNSLVTTFSNSADNISRLVSIMTNVESPINQIIDRLETNGTLATVLQAAPANTIGDWFDDNSRLTADNKAGLVNVISDNATLLSHTLTMSNGRMHEAFENILPLAGNYSTEVNGDIQNVLEQMAITTIGRGRSSNGADMLDQLVSTYGLGSLNTVIDTLCANGEYADIGDMLGNWHLGNTNEVIDRLEATGNFGNVVANMDSGNFFSLLDREVLTGTDASTGYYGALLDQIVISSSPSTIGQLLLTRVNDNCHGPTGTPREDLINKLFSREKLDDVLATYSSSQASTLLGWLDNSDTTALTNMGLVLANNSFSFNDGSAGCHALDNLNPVDTERVVNTWGALSANGASAVTAGTNSLLSAVIDEASQLDINNWLSDLNFGWSSNSVPNLSTLSAGLTSLAAGDPGAVINGDTAITLIQAAGAEGANVIKSAFVQEALSAGIGELDFSSPLGADMLDLLAGLMVNDPTAFLEGLGMAAQAEVDGVYALDNSALAEINSLLSINHNGQNLSIGRSGWEAGGSPVTLTPGAATTISMNVNGTDVYIDTQMSMTQKLEQLTELFSNIHSSNAAEKERAIQDVSNLLIAVAGYDQVGNAEQADAATTIIDAMINGYTNLTTGAVRPGIGADNVNSVMFELASSESGANFLEVYMLTDSSLYTDMFSGFLDYCATQGSEGLNVFTNLLNANYHNSSSGILLNSSLNQLLDGVTALQTTNPANFNAVMNGLEPETVAGMLNNDDINEASKTALREGVLANWANADIADIFNANDTTSGIDISLNWWQTEAFINAMTPTRLQEVLADSAMTNEDINLITGRIHQGSTAITAVFTALEATNDTSAMAYLLEPGRMGDDDKQEHLMSIMSDTNLSTAIGIIGGADTASLIKATIGHDARIMEQAAATLSGIESHALLDGLSSHPTAQSAYIDALASPDASKLQAVLSDIGVSQVQSFITTFGISDSALNNVYENLVSSSINAMGVSQMLTIQEPFLSNDQIQEMVCVLEDNNELGQVMTAMANTVIPVGVNGPGITALFLNSLTNGESGVSSDDALTAALSALVNAGGVPIERRAEVFEAIPSNEVQSAFVQQAIEDEMTLIFAHCNSGTTVGNLAAYIDDNLTASTADTLVVASFADGASTPVDFTYQMLRSEGSDIVLRNMGNTNVSAAVITAAQQDPDVAGILAASIVETIGNDPNWSPTGDDYGLGSFIEGLMDNSTTTVAAFEQALETVSNGDIDDYNRRVYAMNKILDNQHELNYHS